MTGTVLAFSPGVIKDNYHLLDNFQTAGRKTKKEIKYFSFMAQLDNLNLVRFTDYTHSLTV